MHIAQVCKQWDDEKIPSSSGIYKAICHSGNYLLLFGKRK